MKNTFSLLCIASFLIFPAISNAQDYAKVDSMIRKYPKGFTSIDRLASRINKDFTKEDEKARAVFTWIALNIRYDIQESLKTNNTTSLSEEEYAAKVLISRKGVCYGYATLFKSVGEKVGLDVALVTGYAKTEIEDIAKPLKDTDHAWNAVKIGGQWKLIDATWGSGRRTDGLKPKFVAEYDDVYFFTDPDKFFRKHFPEDKKWLLTNKTEKDFIELPLYHSIEYDILAPLHGAITVSGMESIEFRISGVKESDTVYYTFQGDEYATEAEYNLQDSVAIFYVPVSGKTAGILDIAVNFNPLASYKIEFL